MDALPQADTFLITPRSRLIDPWHAESVPIRGSLPPTTERATSVPPASQRELADGGGDVCNRTAQARSNALNRHQHDNCDSGGDQSVFDRGDPRLGYKEARN